MAAYSLNVPLMKICALLICVMMSGFRADAQVGTPPTNSTEEARRAAAQAEAERRRQSAAYARLKSISDKEYRLKKTHISELDGIYGGPSLSNDDKKAITVDAGIRDKYQDLLKRGKAGVIRLHNADVCKPNDLVVAATGGCPNNVIAKATAFSFRTRDYVSTLFSDVFFKGTALWSTGAYTIGIFAKLGNPDLRSLDMKSEGVHQLAGFAPPADMASFDRQSAILRRGVQIDAFTYLPKAEVNPGDVFVLRSVAYRAKLYRGEKPRRINVLADDERADVTIAFEIAAILSDGSVVIVWRELKRSSPPRVVLEARAQTGPG